MALAAAVMLVAGAPASAATWTDNVGYINDEGTQPPGGWTPVLVNTTHSYTYTHSIVGDPGFVPDGTQIYDVDLQIWLADDAGSDYGSDGSEYFKVSWVNGSWTSAREVDGSIACSWWSGCNWDDFEFSPDESLLRDGVLSVTIKSTQGDFYFKRSLLTVTGRSVSVPEPATLALMGMGMLFAGFAVRRRTAAITGRRA
jgi:hypothetical protein